MSHVEIAALADTANAYLLAIEVSSLQEAYDEVCRELAVRERCFPRWVAEGRLSATDSQDRLRRQRMAKECLYYHILAKGAPVPEPPEN